MKRAVVAAAVALGIALLLLAFARVTERGRWALPYSTFGAGPRGARAAFELTSRYARSARRWTEDLGALPDRAVLIALGGCDHAASRALSRPERERLVRWVAAGGTLIVAGARSYVPVEFGVRIPTTSVDGCEGSLERALGRVVDAENDDEDEPRGSEGLLDVLRRAAAPEDLPEPRWGEGVGLLGGMGWVGMRRATALEAPSWAEPLVRDAEGQPLGVRVAYGEGHVILFGSASMLQNQDLVVVQGAPLLARLLAAHGEDRDVFFDEYHLGAGQRRGLVRWLTEVGFGPLLVQLALVLGLALWRGGVRFGAPRRPIEEPPATTETYIGAIGALFAGTRDAEGALGLVRADALARVARHHRVDATTAEALVQTLRQRGRHDAAEAVEAMAGVRADHASEASLVRAVEALDALVARATRSRL